MTYWFDDRTKPSATTIAASACDRGPMMAIDRPGAARIAGFGAHQSRWDRTADEPLDDRDLAVELTGSLDPDAIADRQSGTADAGGHVDRREVRALGRVI